MFYSLREHLSTFVRRIYASEPWTAGISERFLALCSRHQASPFGLWVVAVEPDSQRARQSFFPTDVVGAIGVNGNHIEAKRFNRADHTVERLVTRELFGAEFSD